MSNNYKCLIADDMHESVIFLLKDIGVTATYLPQITRQEIIDQLSEYEVLFIRSKTHVDEDLLQNAHKLKIVGRAGAGIDNLDETYLSSKNIAVINAPEGNRDAVGEQTIGMLLSLMHNIHKSHLEVISKTWDRAGNRGIELAGKTVGIIGYGNMGKAFAKRLSGFGCTVLAYDKYRKEFEDEFCTAASLSEIHTSADILSLHVPLTDETRGWIDDDFFSAFKKSIYFLNLARGEIASLNAVKNALEQGKLLGAALDVLENEKLDTLNLEQEKVFEYLSKAANVILTPHIGGWSHESYIKINEVLVNKLNQIINSDVSFT